MCSYNLCRGDCYDTLRSLYFSLMGVGCLYGAFTYIYKRMSLSNKFFVRQVFVLYRKVCIFVLRAVQLYRKLKEKK